MLTERELIGKVHSSVYRHCQEKGYATPVDILMDVGVLSKQKYEEWRFGRIPYLEQACTCNLKQLSFIMKQIRTYAGKVGLEPSFCYYKQWGTKKHRQGKTVIPLVFSKSRKPEIEKAYATHFVDKQRVAQLQKAELEGAVSAEP